MTPKQIILTTGIVAALGGAGAIAALSADECAAAIVMTQTPDLRAVVACGPQGLATDVGEQYEVLEQLGTFPRPEPYEAGSTYEFIADRGLFHEPMILDHLRCAMACGGDCRLVATGEPAPTCQELAAGTWEGSGCRPKTCGEYGALVSVYGLDYSMPSACRAVCRP